MATTRSYHTFFQELSYHAGPLARLPCKYQMPEALAQLKFYSEERV